MSIEIRPADLRDVPGSDLHKIGSSWVSTAWGMHRWCSRSTFATEYMRAVQRELARSDSWVACYKHEPILVLGWLCGDTRRGLLHYVCVGRQYRNCGIAKALVARFLDECPSDKIVLTAHAASSSLRQLGPYRPQLFGAVRDTEGT